MAYSIKWYIEEKVILTTYESTLTLEELKESNQQTIDFANHSTQKVHNIIDIRTLEKFPTNIIEMLHVSNSLKHENIGWFVILGSSSLQRYVVGLLGQLFNAQVSSVNKFEEALDLLRSKDSNLSV